MSKNQMSNKSKSAVSRRGFLATAAAGSASAAIALSQKSAKGRTPAPKRGRVRWRFEARRVEKTFLDGSTVPFFRFVVVGSTRSNGAVPLMQDEENRKVCVSIENLVDFPIQPTILDYESGPIIMPQETGLWEFTMPPEGTWMFTESLLGNVASSAGFGAAMISNSATDPVKMRQYYLLYQDADDRWNNAIDNGNVPDETVFEPNYHTLNGLSYPDTMNDSDTRLNCTLGEEVLVRVGNLSNVRHSLHFHGFHAQLLRRNNKFNNTLPEKDTFGIPAFSTTEIVMPVVQVGEYPLHPHGLTTTTDNGLYQGGSGTMIDAQIG